MKQHIHSLVDLDLELIERKGLVGFVKAAWPMVQPGVTYQHNWHIDEVCKHLEALYKGEIKNLIINIPPSCMKTLLGSVLFPAWIWATQNPGYKFLNASFDSDLSVRAGRQIRELVESKWWKERFPHIGIKKDAGAVGDFETTHGGFRLATSPKGKGTGRHVHLITADDPHKPIDIARGGDQSVEAQTVWEWWTGTVPTRAADPANFHKLVIMQRLAENDLCGRIIEEMNNPYGGSEHFEVLRLPMEYNPVRHCNTRIGGDKRTEPNELLWKGRFTRERVEALKGNLRAIGGEQNVAGQLEQEPRAKGGNRFQESWIQHWGTADSKFPNLDFKNPFMRFGMSWDCTFKGASETKGKPDYVVGQLWAYLGKDAFLVDQVRGQWGFSETLIEFKKLCEKWPRCYIKKIEDKANGPAVANVLMSEISGIEMVNPQGGKEARASAVEPLWRGMNVWLPPLNYVNDNGDAWVPLFIRELLAFPKGRNDDMVDTMTQELLEMASGNNLELMREYLAAMRG